MAGPRFHPAGVQALLVVFADHADAQTAAQVRALDGALAGDPPPGLVECVPTGASLMAVFDPLITDHAGVEAALRARLATPPPLRASPVLHRVGVSFAPAFAPDLGAVAEGLGMEETAVVAGFLGAEYRVAFYGFAPGYAYLDGVPEALRLPRKPVPQRAVPAGSVVIAGGQCLITTLTMPTGWWIIGRSDFKVLTDDPAHPFAFAPGDRIRFEAAR